MISDHFGERWESTDCNKMCDHCASDAVSSHSLVEIDISEFAEAVLKILARAKVSILSTFYVCLFCMKVLFEAFL
jgi:hypothetical protein